MCCERSWAGFKAGWEKEEVGRKGLQLVGHKSADQLKQERTLEAVRGFVNG